MPIPIKLARNHCVMRTIRSSPNGLEQQSLVGYCRNGPSVSLLSLTAVKEVPYLCSAALHPIVTNSVKLGVSFRTSFFYFLLQGIKNSGLEGAPSRSLTAYLFC